MNDVSEKKTPEHEHEHEHEDSTWHRFITKLWDLLPWAIPALAGAVLTGGLTIRDNTHAIGELRLDVASLEQSAGAIGECVKRPECDAVRQLLGELQTRVRAVEIAVESHDDTSKEWKARIVSVEADLKRLTEIHAGRVVPSDLKDLEGRIRELERYKDLDQERMENLNRRRQ